MIEKSFINLAVFYLVAITSPGPSLILIIRNGFLYFRKSSVWTALGIVLGITCQAGIVLIGIKLITHNQILFNCIKIICSLYLIYLGAINLFNKNGIKLQEQDLNKSILQSKWVYFRQGLYVEILNPMALTFFLTLFSIFIKPQATIYLIFLYWLEIVIIGAFWFLSVSLISTSPFIYKHIRKYRYFLEKLLGITLIVLGIDLLFLLL